MPAVCTTASTVGTLQMAGVEHGMGHREDRQGEQRGPSQPAVEAQCGSTEQDGERQAVRADVTDEVLVVRRMQRHPGMTA